MSKPWMPLYIDDYLGATSHLRAAQSGAYLHLIMHYWRKGSLPNDDLQLATIAKMTDAEWKKSKSIIAAFFQDGWTHDRIDAELAKAGELSDKRRDAANKRHANAPAKDIQLDTHARAFPQSTVHTPATSPDGEAAAAPPPLDLIEIKKRCEDAAGFGDLPGFDLIAKAILDHGPDRVVAVLADKGASMRRRKAKPDGWAYFLPCFADPAWGKPPPPQIVPPAMVWIDAGTPSFDRANAALIARGEPPKASMEIGSQPNRGASFPAWATQAEDVAA